GHQHPAAACYDLGVGTAIGRDGTGRDLFNDVAPDQNAGRSRKRRMRAVKYPDVLDDGDGRALLRVRRHGPHGGCGCNAACKSEESATAENTHVSSTPRIIALRDYCRTIRLWNLPSRARLRGWLTVGFGFALPGHLRGFARRTLGKSHP